MTWEQPPLPPEYRERLRQGREQRWGSQSPPPLRASPGQRRRDRLVAWFVGLPYAVLAFCWIGFLLNVDSWNGLTWLFGMWMACIVMVPAAILGAVWAGQQRRFGAMWWGIGAAVLCLPGFVLGVPILGSTLATLFR